MLLMCFINDDERENIWLWGDLETTLPLQITLELGILCKGWGENHIIYSITCGGLSLWGKHFSVHKLPLQNSLGGSTINTGFLKYIPGS